MRGLPFNAQEKGAFEAALGRSLAGGGGPGGGKGAAFWSGKGVIQEGGEPRSVLDHRSPSPQNSTSTLSSSLCGGGSGGSSDTAGVVAVSDRPTPKWPLSDSAATEDTSGATMRKDERPPEPLPLAAGAGIELGFVAGGEKCGFGVEDWEMMLSGNSAVPPSQEQTFLRWIMGDVEVSSAAGAGAAAAVPKQQQQQQLLISHLPSEFDCNNGNLGFGVIDTAFELEPVGGIGGATSPMVSFLNPSPTLAFTGGLSLMSGNNRISPTPVIPSVKGTTFATQDGGSLLLTPPPLHPSSLPLNTLQQPSALSSAMFFQGATENMPQLLGTGLVNKQPPPLHIASSSPFFLPLPVAQQEQQSQPLLPPQLKRHHSMVDQLPPKLPFMDPGGDGGADLFQQRHQPNHQLQKQSFPNCQTYHLHQRSVKPNVWGFGDELPVATAAQQQQHAVVDQLFEAAKMIESGNSASARGILARLNQQLPSPLGQPLLRTAFYFKEALQRILADGGPGHHPPSAPNHQLRGPSAILPSNPLDVVLKLAAYKAFSEVSPVLQFTNFTCTQALLEELSGCHRIHIVDFDIGIGGQWSSFMQELAQRRSTEAGLVPLLKITAFVSSASHHPLELHLTKENLSHFASDLNIPFQFNILSLDSFNSSDLLGLRDEAIAVNLPVGTAHNLPFPTLISLIRQLSPRILLSVDQGCDRSDLPFSHHLLHALQSSVVLLESIDAAGTNHDVSSKVERFLLQPRIENAILGRHCATEKMLPWRTLFASAGFTPFQFSNFTESQAECLLKRVQVRGFHLEKRQASLFLYWQRGELVSVSAWKC